MSWLVTCHWKARSLVLLISTLPSSCCVTLGKSLFLFTPQFALSIRCEDKFETLRPFPALLPKGSTDDRNPKQGRPRDGFSWNSQQEVMSPTNSYHPLTCQGLSESEQSATSLTPVWDCHYPDPRLKSLWASRTWQTWVEGKLKGPAEGESHSLTHHPGMMMIKCQGGEEWR